MMEQKQTGSARFSFFSPSRDSKQTSTPNTSESTNSSKNSNISSSGSSASSSSSKSGRRDSSNGGADKRGMLGNAFNLGGYKLHVANFDINAVSPVSW